MSIKITYGLCHVFLLFFIYLAFPAVTSALVCPNGTTVYGTDGDGNFQCINGATRWTEVPGGVAPGGEKCAAGFTLWQRQPIVGAGSTGAPAGYQCYNTDTGAASTAAPEGKGTILDPNSCSTIDLVFVNIGKCIFIPIMGWLGATVLAFGMFVLQVAGFLFNVLVQQIVIGFGSSIQELGLLSGIHTGWEVLRDIANIVIIGMFTFIAISMILGSETYGAKKMVARVLIIAVLINFSLLFSKIIIDTGNFVAYQFYRGMGSGINNSGSNIADKFLAIVGVTGIADTGAVATSFGQQLQQAGVKSDSSWTNSLKAGMGAFFFGVIAGALLLIAAGVLLYGSYLIAVRAVLLVFLMLVSALAFATYLVPKLSESGYGWKTWWQSLINASAFAPLLMILLYISLVILTPAAGSKDISLGKNLSNPSSMANNWKTLVIFILGIGMLYVSLRVASSFSHRISGFDFADTGLRRSIGIPLALTSRAIGLAGRWTRGRGAIKGEIEERKAAAMAHADFQSALPGSPEQRQALDKYIASSRKADRLKARSESSYNMLQSKAGRQLADVLKVPKFARGSDQKGAADAVKHTAEEAAKAAEGFAKLSPEAERRQRENAENIARKAREQTAKQMQEEKEMRERHFEEQKAEARKSLDATKAGEVGRHDSTEAAAERNKEQIKRDEMTVLKQLAEDAKRPGANQETIKIEVEKTKQASANALAFEEERIKTAREKTRQILEEVYEPVGAAGKELDESVKKLSDYNAETEQLATAAGQQAVTQLRQQWKEQGKAIATEVAKEFSRSGIGGTLASAAGLRSDNSATSVMIEKILDQRIKTAGLRESAEAITAAMKGAGINLNTNGGAAPAPTPAAPKDH